MENNVSTEERSFFDSSLSDALNVSLSSDEYKETLVRLLQPILNQHFVGNPAKQKIYVHRDRINFACPVCADSMKSDYKKRGNFILTGKHKGFFKCFNCGHFQRIDNFFKDFKIDVDLSVINYISKEKEDFAHQTNTKYDMSLFLDLESIDKFAIDRQEFSQYFKLMTVTESPVWAWLKYRLQFDTSKFLYNPRENHLIILNLTHTGKILGVQKRLFKGETKYLTFKLSKLYELMGKNPNEIPEEINAISQIFNICLIDFSKPTTLCEGPLDSFLLHNSIANCGANKSFPLDISIRYCYDFDKTGKEHSIEKINQGEQVFLWTKFIKDYELPYRLKWDLSDAMIFLKNQNKKVPRFDDYFSNDALDMIDI